MKLKDQHVWSTTYMDVEVCVRRSARENDSKPVRKIFLEWRGVTESSVYNDHQRISGWYSLMIWNLKQEEAMSLGRREEEWCGCLWWNTKEHLKLFPPPCLRVWEGEERKQSHLEWGCKEAPSPRESWVSYSKKVKCMVLKIQGILLATDSDFRRHNERVSKVEDDVREKEVKATIDMKFWGLEVTWDSWLLVAFVWNRDKEHHGIIPGGLIA